MWDKKCILYYNQGRSTQQLDYEFPFQLFGHLRKNTTQVLLADWRNVSNIPMDEAESRLQKGTNPASLNAWTTNFLFFTSNSFWNIWTTFSMRNGLIPNRHQNCKNLVVSSILIACSSRIKNLTSKIILPWGCQICKRIRSKRSELCKSKIKTSHGLILSSSLA